MGTNYYLIIKKPYDKNDKLYQYQNYYKEVRELKNGYIYDDFYYPTIDKLNEKYEYKLHIGKSSYGWHFSLCTYPDLNINSLDDWKELFKNNKIINECDEEVSSDDMINTITNRGRLNWEESKREEFEKQAIERLNSLSSKLGCNHYDTYDDYLNENNAERGVNGLLKHKSSYYREFTNDGGTYDLTSDWDFS